MKKVIIFRNDLLFRSETFIKEQARFLSRWQPVLVGYVGMAQRAHVWNLLLFFVTVPLLWVAAKLGGLFALAWTMLAWQAVVYILAWRFLIQPACGVDFVTYNGSMIPPLLSTALASALAVGAVSLLPASVHLPLGSLVLGGAYLLLSWYFNRQWIEVMTELLRIPMLARKK
jgi:hypothetical protein